MPASDRPLPWAESLASLDLAITELFEIDRTAYTHMCVPNPSKVEDKLVCYSERFA